MPKFPPQVQEKISEYQAGLVLQSSDLSLGAIANMVERGTVDISPTFQRRDRWKAKAQSQLIESFLLNIPVPPVYLSEDDEGNYAVIDGKQRITAIHRFMNGSLTLTGLEVLRELNGLRIEDFPSAIKNPLEVRPYVRAVTLLRQSHDQVRYEVFLRLNIAGVPLSAMEVRKVAFRGDYCDMIFEEAENDFLKDRLKISSDHSSAYRNMMDAEFVLRFLALRETWQEFGGSYRDALDDHMKEFARAESDVIASHRRSFQRVMHYTERLWGNYAFQRPAERGWRDQAIAGVFDAETIAVDMQNDARLDIACKRSKQVVAKTRELFENDPQFLEASTLATNNASRIRYRIERMSALLQEVIES